MNIDVERHIVPYVQDAAPLRAALAVERQRGITPGDWRHGYVTQRGQRLTGLTPLLERVCWDTTTPRARLPATGSKRRRSHSAGGGAASVMDHMHGAPRGTLVHKQIKDLVTMDAATFRRRNVQGAHPWACRIVDALLARNWVPAAADLSVYDEQWGIATEIDVLCVHIPSGDLICVEIKTGYRENWTHAEAAGGGGTVRMRGATLRPLLPDAPYYRALVQSMVSMLLLVRGHSVPGRVGCAVVRIDERCIDVSVVDGAFVRRHGPALMHELAAAAAAGA
jgi:hypothetical protein